MTSPSITYTFTNGTTADATQVNQNFSDLLNALIDSAKDLDINDLTLAGSMVVTGNVTVGATMVCSSVVQANTFADRAGTSAPTFPYGCLIKGVSDGSSASTGYLGEYVEAKSTVDVNIGSGSWINVDSISLTAGDWDVTGVNDWSEGTSVTHTELHSAISLYSSTTTTDHADGHNVISDRQAANFIFKTQVVPTVRISITSTTTVYLKFNNASWTAGTGVITGHRISARRVR